MQGCIGGRQHLAKMTGGVRFGVDVTPTRSKNRIGNHDLLAGRQSLDRLYWYDSPVARLLSAHHALWLGFHRWK